MIHLSINNNVTIYYNYAEKLNIYFNEINDMGDLHT